MPPEVVQQDTELVPRCSQHEQRCPARQAMKHQSPQGPFDNHLSGGTLSHRSTEGSEIPNNRYRVRSDRVRVEGGRECSLDDQPLIAHHGDAGDFGSIGQGEEDGAERLHRAGLRVAGGTGQATIVAAAKSSNDGGLPRLDQRSNLPVMKVTPFLLAVAIVAAACSGNQLPPAQISNVVDTVTLGALDGSDLRWPAAYSVAEGFAVRTDQSSSFDFIYNIDKAGRHVLLPLEVIGLGSSGSADPGLQKVTVTFDNLGSAPVDGYVSNDTLAIAVGDVIAARSRIACSLGVPEYAKLQVLSFDDTQRTMKLQVLANINCGYRSLTTGVPTS